jgi:magnesium-transporting ATPase (P-type)
MIRDARSLTENGRQAFAFYIGIQFGLSVLVLGSYVSLIPNIFTGYQIMFVIWVIGPMIALSMLFTPHLPDIMTHMPAKNADHGKDVPRFVMYYILRFATIPVIACIGVFWLVLLFIDTAKPATAYFLIKGYDRLFLFIQNYVLVIFTVYIIAISATFIHRIEGVLVRSPFLNPVWVSACALALLFQVVFFWVSVGFDLLILVPWWIHLASVVPVLLIVIVNELVKRHGRQEWIRFQKRTKLEFNTKLGMHSPL